MKETRDDYSTVNGRHSQTLLTMEGKENFESKDRGQSEEPGSKKLLYKVDEVPPPGILLSVAFQVG